jgi:acyl-CoA synthetase (AMP-forming)/AMP-acid ligase II
MLMAALQPDMLNLASRDRLMPVVPLFHANGWSTAFSAPMSGCAMVMPGAGMDGESIYEMLTQEKVTITAAVPTVWLMLLQRMEKDGGELPDLNRGDRRLGLPARHHQGFPGRLWRGCHPCLGHDRDEPAWNPVFDQAGVCPS